MVNDVVFNLSNLVSSDVSTLWVCVRSRLIISARLQPLHSVDKLRSSVKAGECFRSPLELLVHLLRDQGEVLTQIVRKTSLSVDQVEDQLLSSRLPTNRAELGANRRVLVVRLQRLLALEPGSLLRLLNRPPQWLQKEDVKELRKSTEEFALIINDLTALGERIKLLGRNRRQPQRTEQPHPVHPDRGHRTGPADQHHCRLFRHERRRRTAVR